MCRHLIGIDMAHNRIYEKNLTEFDSSE